MTNDRSPDSTSEPEFPEDSKPVTDETRPMQTPRRVKLGPFRLEERIGEGGMGIVYRAYDPQLRRAVAIKRIHERYEKDEAYNRLFLGEARAVAAVSHPNIAQIFSIHPGEDDEPSFFAMEYVEGLSVESRVRASGPVPIPLAIEIGIQAARGLRAAHRNGIVHRDVKPSNLLLDETNQVKLVDFGLAIQTAELDPPTEDDDQILCTPHYVSPEQARGWRVDQRSDIYSLGCTLYFVLTGREPFQREQRSDLFAAHANETAEPPSAHRDGIPPELDRLILRMLEKRPEDRPGQYEPLLEEFDALLAQVQPTSAAATRRPVRTFMSVTVLIAAAATAGVFASTRDTGPPTFPVEEYYKGIYIADSPEKLHFNFAAPDAADRMGNLFPSFEVDLDQRGVIPPVIQDGALVWKHYSQPIPLTYVKDFREIELRGLLFLNKQHFQLRIGDDRTYRNRDGLDLSLAVGGDLANDRVVTVTVHGESREVKTSPSRLDFRVKPEEYVMRLVRDDDVEKGWSLYRFSLEQELADGRTATQASFEFRLPDDAVRAGAIVLSSDWPQQNQNTVKIKEILIRGTLDRERLALERGLGTL